jgi:hypothetical protein
MIWLCRISASLGGCCDVLRVWARIFAFSDRMGRLAMKVQACHLLVPRLRVTGCCDRRRARAHPDALTTP